MMNKRSNFLQYFYSSDEIVKYSLFTSSSIVEYYIFTITGNKMGKAVKRKTSFQQKLELTFTQLNKLIEK